MSKTSVKPESVYSFSIRFKRSGNTQNIYTKGASRESIEAALKALSKVDRSHNLASAEAEIQKKKEEIKALEEKLKQIKLG